MKTKNFILRNWLAIVFLAIPFIAIPFVWPMLPEVIPIHWNFSGEADGFASKAVGLILLPLINVALFLLLGVIGKIDPKGKAGNMEKVMQVIRTLMAAFLTCLFFFMVYYSLYPGIFDVQALLYLILVVFLVLGNYMGKLRPNYFVGIRTPWTLNNDTIWYRTHRMAGSLWVLASVIMMVLGGIVSSYTFKILFFVYVGLLVLIPVIHSYLEFRKIRNSEE